jgi:hypothetical protein
MKDVIDKFRKRLDSIEFMAVVVGTAKSLGARETILLLHHSPTYNALIESVLNVCVTVSCSHFSADVDARSIA